MILLLSLSLSLSLEHILPKLFHVWFHCRVYWRTLCPAHGVETNPRPTPRFSTFQNYESPGHLHYGFRICSLTNCSYKLISYDNFWWWQLREVLRHELLRCSHECKRGSGAHVGAEDIGSWSVWRLMAPGRSGHQSRGLTSPNAN